MPFQIVRKLKIDKYSEWKCWQW